MPDGLRHKDITDYRYDFHSTAALDERHRRGVWEMHWLVLPAPVVADRLIALYRRHCAEWCQFPASSLAQLHRKAA